MTALPNSVASGLTCVTLLWSTSAWAGDETPATAPKPAVVQVDPSSGPELSLTDILAHAECHSPLLEVTLRQLEYGKVAREAAEPSLLDNPKVQFQMGPRFGEGKVNYDWWAYVEQSLNLAGAVGKTRVAAERLDKRIRMDVQVRRFEIRRAITVAYRDAMLARRRRDVAEKVASFEDELVEIARKRAATGSVSEVELFILESDQAAAHQDALSNEQKLLSARLVLAEVAGYSLETPPNVPAASENPQKVPPLETLRRRALATHPELIRANAAVGEAEAHYTLAEALAWPKPTFAVQLQREGSVGPDAPNYILLGLVGVQLPLFQRNQADRGRSNADHDVAIAQRHLLERSLSARLTRARIQLVSAERRLALQASAQSPPLGEKLQRLLGDFGAGKLSAFDITLAVERLLKAWEVNLSAESDYLDALSELETALGETLPNPKNEHGE